jgi:mono/diheme cytochrome c family protein
MKSAIVICLVFSMMIVACHKNAAPTVTDSTGQPKAPAPAALAFNPTAADLQAGKVIYDTKCIRCHKPKPVGDYTSERWTNILKTMVRKSRLDSVQTLQVTAYVHANAKK